MATTIDSSSNPLAAYGYDAQTGQQLAQSLGITTQQLAAAMATTPQTGGGPNMQGGSYGKSAGFSLPGADQSSTIQQLQMLKAAGALGGGNQGQGGPPTSQMGQVSNDPMNAATNLGAAALGMPAIYNPTPGQIPAGSKGGIAQVASPVSSGTVPNAPSGPWNTTAGVMANQQQAQGAQVYQGLGGSGNPGNTALQGFYNMGVQQGTIPGQGTPATGGTPVGVKPANAPGGAPATPWATAPAAPTASAQPQAPLDFAAMGTHTTALADAGRAFYQHMTGNDPESANHSDILNFHQQLLNTIGGGAGATPFGQAPAGAVNYTAGVPATGATPQTALGITPPPGLGGAPAKMASGGMVPGRGNQDTVPALLTPGEYVIPKQQTAQIFGGRQPIRMADGGFVPPEERRQRITTPGAPPPAPSQTQAASTDQQSSDSSLAPPAAPSGGNQGYWSSMVNQAQIANMGSGGPGSIDSLGTLGDEGLANEAMGGSAASGAAGGADMASGLISGLQKAVDTYAKSIKPWQMQQQAFGRQGTPNYQDVNLQQDTTV